MVARDAAALLPDCLTSLAGVDALLVIDNRSTDATAPIACRHGATVHSCPIDDMGRLREIARQHAQRVQAHWMIMLDADERLPPDGIARVRAAIKDRPEVAAFALPIRTYLGARWLRWGGYYPARRLRIFAVNRVHWPAQRVHERAECDGPIARLDLPITHLSYRDLDHAEAKLRRYAAWAAEQDRAVGRRMGRGAALFRAGWRFIKVALLRHGWLMGRLGWRLAALQARSVWWRYR